MDSTASSEAESRARKSSLSAPEPPRAESTSTQDEEEGFGAHGRLVHEAGRNKTKPSSLFQAPNEVKHTAESLRDGKNASKQSDSWKAASYQPPLPPEGVFTDHEKRLCYYAVNIVIFLLAFMIGLLILFCKPRDKTSLNP